MDKRYLLGAIITVFILLVMIVINKQRHECTLYSLGMTIANNQLMQNMISDDVSRNGDGITLINTRLRMIARGSGSIIGGSSGISDDVSILSDNLSRLGQRIERMESWAIARNSYAERCPNEFEIMEATMRSINIADTSTSLIDSILNVRPQ